MADHRLVFGTEQVLMHDECPADEWPNPEKLEQILSRLDRRNTHWVARVVDEVELRAPPRRRVLEHPSEQSVVGEVHRRDRLVVEGFLAIGIPEHHEPIGLVIRERSKHHPLEEAEDGGGRANAKTEG